jgi:VanZ family protein
MRRFARYQLPAILWATVILLASGDVFSSQHSGHWLRELIIALVGHPIPVALFEWIHIILRKVAHLAEYGVLGALMFRAVRADASVRWTLRWALLAVALATTVAGIDEFRQRFVPSRTASPADVAVDAVGATLAQVLIRLSMLF